MADKTTPREGLQTLLDLASTEHGRVLTSPGRTHLDPDTLAHEAAAQARIESTLAALKQLKVLDKTKLVPDTTVIPVGDIKRDPATQTSSPVAEGVPQAIHDELEALARECEYLLLQYDEIIQGGQQRVQEAISQYRMVKPRVEALIQQLESRTDNIYARIMLMVLKQGITTLDRLSQDFNPRKELFRQLQELYALAMGPWPISEVRQGPQGKEDRTLLQQIRSRMTTIGAFIPADHPLYDFKEDLIRVHGDINLLNGVFVFQTSEKKLNEQFPEGVPGDFIDSIIPNYKAAAELFLMQIQLQYGTSETSPPPDDAAQQLEALEKIIEGLYDEYSDIFAAVG